MATMKQRAAAHHKATAIQRFARPTVTDFVLGFGADGKVTTPSLAKLTPIPRSRISRESIVRNGVPAEAWPIPHNEVSKNLAADAAMPAVDSDRESVRLFIKNLHREFGEKPLNGTVSVFAHEGALFVGVTV